MCQDYGDGSSRVPLLCEQCVFRRCLPSRALLKEPWHTENPASAINLAHTPVIRAAGLYTIDSDAILARTNSPNRGH